MKVFFYFSAILIIIFFVNSCQDSMIAPPNTQDPIITDGAFCSTANLFCGSPGRIKTINGCGGSAIGDSIILWAGVGNSFTGGTRVGHVELSIDGAGKLIVKYVFTNSDFNPTNIHFAIATTKDGIPHNNKGNPVPGQFQYTFNGTPVGNVYQFEPITLPGPSTLDSFYIAAHTSGVIGSQQCFNGTIPASCVTVSNVHHQFELGSYFDFILANAGSLSGTYNGWCIDLSMVHQENVTFNCARLYSSLLISSIPPADLGNERIDHPENFDKVNYLLNHFKVGEPLPPSSGCPTATGNILPMDIQAVIWYFIDATPQSIDEWDSLAGPLADWWAYLNINRIKAMICDVNAHGEGFVPSCTNGDKVGIIVIPDGENAPFTVQPMLITVPCNCGTEVTAWGDGRTGGTFSSSTWATYFKWKKTCN